MTKNSILASFLARSYLAPPQRLTCVSPSEVARRGVVSPFLFNLAWTGCRRKEADSDWGHPGHPWRAVCLDEVAVASSTAI